MSLTVAPLMPQPPSSESRYREAGVDIDAGEQLVQRISALARRTCNAQVLSGLGGFGGLYQLPTGYQEPVLVCGTDGVGTKLRLTRRLDRCDTIGVDLVAMCANDILTQGARALLFLDYYACSRLNVDEAEAVVRGIAQGCTEAGCALLGGETAEMPGLYAEGDYDLAGFCVGIAERARLLPAADIAEGDYLIGLDSSGVHANGFSLINAILDRDSEAVDEARLNTLLTPTRIYEPHVRALLEAGKLLGMAHITGGGLTDNVPRVLPDGLGGEIDMDSWERPEIFNWIQTQGKVTEEEMRQVYNCGIGMVLLARETDAEHIIAQVEATAIGARIIGRVIAQDGAERLRYQDAP